MREPRLLSDKRKRVVSRSPAGSCRLSTAEMLRPLVSSRATIHSVGVCNFSAGSLGAAPSITRCAGGMAHFPAAAVPLIVAPSAPSGNRTPPYPGGTLVKARLCV